MIELVRRAIAPVAAAPARALALKSRTLTLTLSRNRAGEGQGGASAEGRAGRNAGARGITINSSPHVTVNVPPGAGGADSRTLERAVGAALEKHAERIFAIVQRVGAIRARTEF